MWTYGTLYKHPRETVLRVYQLFRDMGCTGGMVYTGSGRNYRRDHSLEFHVEDSFPFYVENLVAPFITGWDEGKKQFFRQYEEFGRTRDRRVFTKVPCLNDPKVVAEQETHVREVMTELAPGRHLARYYDIRDEPSTGSFILANDTCFCEHCMTKMRTWLRDEVYGTLGALNAEWGTTYEAWDDVAPLTTEETIERRRAGNFNFAPWCDHRAFMDKTFTDFYDRMSDSVKSVAPEALVGLEGTQCPSAFGGYDFSRFVPYLDWIEPYAFGGSMEAVRSFKKGPITIFHTSGLGGDAASLRTMLFNGVLDGGGHAGTIIWQSEACLDWNGNEPRLNGEGRVFAEVARFMRSGFSALLTRATEQGDGVALHYSQGSIQACVPLQLRDRRRSWGAFRQEDVSLDTKTRLAWLSLLYDAGTRPTMISSAQVEAGALVDKDLKLFILPWSLALSEKEVAALRTFVEAGGVLLADSMPGRFDGRGKAYVGETPADALFGIRRGEPGSFYWDEQMLFLEKDLSGQHLKPSLRPRGDGVEDLLSPREGTFCMATTETTGTGAMFVNRIGKGVAILLNVMPLSYATARLNGGGEDWRRILEMCLKAAGIRPRVTIRTSSGEPIIGWHTATYQHGKSILAAVVGDMEIRQGTLGETAQSRSGDAGMSAVIDLGRQGYVYEATAGAYLGAGGRAVKDRLSLGWPKLYVVLPYQVNAMNLTARRAEGKVSFRAEIATNGATGDHVFRVELYDAQGGQRPEAGGSFLAPEGRCHGLVTLPKMLDGSLSLRVRDVASGVQAQVKL
jgi:hypothetical protein